MVLLVVGCLVVVILIVILSGPRVRMKVKIESIDFPEDLDGFVKDREGRIENLIPGTEKTILWADKVNSKTEYSIVYFHGFTTTRQEISPVTETIGKKTGSNVFFTRLTGHGIDDIGALQKPLLNDWVNDAWEAYEIAKRIGNKVIFISVSAGSILALWLCLNQKEIAANVMISPMFEPAQSSSRLLLLPWGNLIVRMALGRYREVNIPTTEEFKRLVTTKYPSEALRTMMGLCKFGWGFDLRKLTVPTLCFYTDSDDVVSLPRMKEELAKIDETKKKVVKVDAKHHCLVGDAISPEKNDEVIREIMEFLAKRLNLRVG